MADDINNATATPVSFAKKEGTPIWPKEGLLIEAELIKKGARHVYFDLGKFGTGVVYGVELLNAKTVIRKLEPGARIPVKIVAIDGEDGYVELSLTEAGKHKLWTRAKELQEAGDVVAAKAVGANSGGLMMAIEGLDLKAFLPVSQLSNEHYPKDAEGDRGKIMEQLKKFVGQDLPVKIIDTNSRTNKLIVSERETFGENMKELLQKYEVGQVVQGVVSGIADFGVFVKFADNPDIEGMIHISELAHRIIGNPKEIVSLNDSVQVKIVDIKNGKVFLSLKALQSDPWEQAAAHCAEGQDVSGEVYKLNPFGVLVNLDDGLQGLIHISEFGDAETMKKELEPGTRHMFVISSVKPEEHRIVLKLKK